jgi:hypothetical protein
MTRRVASFFPQRINHWFDGAVVGSFGANTGGSGIAVLELGIMAARDVDGILVAQDMTAIGSTTTFAAAYTGSEAQMGRYGRNIVIDASGAATGNVRVQGRDYLGQPMAESIALNGTNAVQGIRAFRYVDAIDWTSANAVNLTVGWDNTLGLPYRCLAMVAEIKNNTIAANAGTFVAGLPTTNTANATNADPRGTYTPATVVPNAAVSFTLHCVVDQAQLLGVQHYFLDLT